MNTTSGRRARLLILAVGVPLALLLFIAHFVLLGVVSPVPTGDWFLVPEHVGVTHLVVALSLKPLVFVALPVAFMAFGLARAFRKHVSRSGWSSVALVCVWIAVYTLCWLALFTLLAGPNPSHWSAAVVSQSGSLHVLVLAAAGLIVGARNAPAV